MSNAPARRDYVLIAVLMLSAGLTTWWVLSTRELPRPTDSAAGSGPATTTGPAVSGAAAEATSAPPRISPDVPSGRDEPPVLTEQDARQFVKITRGLRASPDGGVLVEAIPPGSVASLLRVEVGDVIMSVNGKPVASPEDFARLYREQGVPRRMTVIHNGREMHRH